MANYKANRNSYAATNYYEYPGRVGVATRSYHNSFSEAATTARKRHDKLKKYNDSELSYFYDVETLPDRLKYKKFKKRG